MADCCIVDVLEPTGLHQLATVHVEPGKIARVAELETSYPADPAEPHSAVGGVLRSGEALLVSPVTEEFVRSVTRDEAHRDAVHALGMRSLIIVSPIAPRWQSTTPACTRPRPRSRAPSSTGCCRTPCRRSPASRSPRGTWPRARGSRWEETSTTCG
jgi:hypothetical protein